MKHHRVADTRLEVEDDVMTFGLILNLEYPVHGSSAGNPWARMEAAELQFKPMTGVSVEKGIVGHELGRHSSIRMARAMN